ncbi:uncharacterized protein LOC107042379 [Diachasma alloeum]|uniref:uncharacterized protein LOC107042379 n=1 Tax=Diachasma alloeum TaxID=454923 RepID=UPI0007384CBC|nr:uncharacterized protein LOC107042379 [Diachasma alloeum]
MTVKDADAESHEEAKSNIRSQAVILARTDKGGATLLMYKEEYLRVMKEIFSDQTTYRKINRDPTSRFQASANALVERLEKEGVVDDMKAKLLKTHNSVIPKMYGLRKVHKDGCKLRPVVSYLKLPSYQVTRLLHALLAKVNKSSKFNIKNPQEFVMFAQDVVLPEGYVLISLDVVSLFTNIPKSLVLEIVEQNWEKWEVLIPASKRMILDLIIFCFEASYFSFNDEIYSQIDGSSMGNPASPILASFVMDYIVSRVLEDLPFSIPWIKIYVDDTVLVAPRDQVANVQRRFNQVYERIQFTVEEEVENSLCFLDLKVVRQLDDNCATIKILNEEKTALASNHFRTGHRFLFDETSILDNEADWKKRNIAEMIHIFLNDTVNKREDTLGLSTMYRNTLSRFKRERR